MLMICNANACVTPECYTCEGTSMFNLAAAAVALARYRAAAAKVAPVVNPEVPLPKVIGR
jgi:hypothetical protein